MVYNLMPGPYDSPIVLSLFHHQQFPSVPNQQTDFNAFRLQDKFQISMVHDPLCRELAPLKCIVFGHQNPHFDAFKFMYVVVLCLFFF